MLTKNKIFNNGNETILIGINKPKGVICTHSDEKNRIRIYDLIPKNILRDLKGNMHSVGRLDFNSQGLILITNNTKIKYYLEKPSSKIQRVYKVKVQGLINNSTVKKSQKGFQIGDRYYSIKSMLILKKTKSYSWILVKLDEGKNQHIRKIFRKIGFSVNKLIRIQYGPYKIGSLETGKAKILNFKKLKLTNI